MIKSIIWGTIQKSSKDWTRSKLVELLRSELLGIESGATVISVGGFGPIDFELRKMLSNRNVLLLTFDIDSSHNPDICGDFSNLYQFQISGEIPKKVDVIIALEVLEHVENIDLAMKDTFRVLSDNGLFIASTPWIIPIHDRPNDFRRLTYFGIELMLNKFTNVKIMARGNYLDSLFALAYRGLMQDSRKSKFFALIAFIFSKFISQPRIYNDIQAKNLNSTIGYFFSARK